VGRSTEKIRSEGGGFKSEASSCGGQRHERVGERDRHKMELPLTELEQPTLDNHTSLVFIPPG
jgi:hypothetical protein